MSRANLSIGIASYGQQPADWWEALAWTTGTLHKYGVDLNAIYTARSMATDGNRNRIVKSFLGGKTEWILWIDTDNIIPMGGVKRLLDNAKPLVCGLYYQKVEPYRPVAYWQLENNRYEPISNWERGEIVPIDAAGMGATLVHRSVYEEIEKQYRIMQRWNGGLFAVHKNDMKGGDLKKRPEQGPQVVNGVLREPVFEPDYEVEMFPHYYLEYGRTEDMVFFEHAKRAGFQLFVDTSVEVPHLTGKNVTGADYRDMVQKEWDAYRQQANEVTIESLIVEAKE